MGTVIVTLDHFGNWCVRVDGDVGHTDGGLPSASSSSSSATMAGQEMNLLIPGYQVSWWPKQDDPLAQHRSNVLEWAREVDAKLDVTPESNGTSTSEVANQRNQMA